MVRGRPSTVGKHKVSIRVLLSREDYQTLKEIADLERSDIGTLVRRAIARHFFMPGNSNAINPSP